MIFKLFELNCLPSKFAIGACIVELRRSEERALFGVIANKHLVKIYLLWLFRRTFTLGQRGER